MSPVTAVAGKFAAQHASAHAQVAEKGAAVVFTKGVTSVAGVAVRVRGNPRKYEALKLVVSEAPTLLFVADTYGDEVPLNAVVEFGGVKYAVRDVDPVAPDGVTITSHVVAAR